MTAHFIINTYVFLSALASVALLTGIYSGYRKELVQLEASRATRSVEPRAFRKAA